MTRTILALALANLFTAVPANAAIEDHFVPLAGEPVLDTAEVIDQEDEQVLNQTLRAFSEANGRQMAIVTVSSLEGYDIETYANQYARFLGIGSEELDDGLVYLIAPNDRKHRIEVGYGLEWSMTDIQSGRTLDIAKPYFREGNYSDGIVAVTDAILPQITPEAEQRAADEAARQAERDLEAKYAFWEFLSWVGIFIGGVITAILGWFLATIPRRRRDRQRIAYSDLVRKSQIDPANALDDILSMDAKERKKAYGSNFDEHEIRRNAISRDGSQIKKIANPTAEERLLALQTMPDLVLEYEDPTQREQEKAIQKNADLIVNIKNPGRRLVDIALRADGRTIRHIESPSENQVLIALTSTPTAIRYLAEPTAAQMMMALNGDGNLIGEIANPSADMRRAALKTTPSAIQHLKNPTAEEIEMALTAEPRTLRHVGQKATHRQMLECIRQVPSVIHHINDPSEEMQLVAVSRDIQTIEYIERPTDAVQKYIADNAIGLVESIRNPNRKTRTLAAELKRRREEEQARRRAEEDRRAAERKRQREEEDRRRRDEATSYGSAGYGYGSSSSSSSSSSFSGGGGDFGGGGASGDW